MFETIINRLNGKKILILGFGREGKATLRFLEKHMPNSNIGIADINNIEIKSSLKPRLHCGPSYLSAISEYDIVVKTPGISLKDIDTTDVEISSQTDLFLSEFHQQTIGVTGSKGKSTTTSLIYHLLSKAGKDCILTGNIGIPCFDIMDNINANTIVVFELSAHQLEYIHNSPHIGVLLNVFEEHLDHFGCFEAYKKAKFNILRHMGDSDYAIVHDSLHLDTMDMFVNQIVFSFIDFDFESIQLPLKGEHNISNIRAALCACLAYGLPYATLIPHLHSFCPLEHRMEDVGVVKGIHYYNDSISTIPQATIAACQTLDKVTILLIGGFDRHIDYSPLTDYLLKHPIPHLLFTGEAGQRIVNILKERGYHNCCHHYDTMDEAFSIIKGIALEGDIVLLSPAAASYDKYKNFEERGKHFKALALSI